MRLGDLDNLKEKIQEIVETEMPIDEKWAMGLRYSLKLIDSAPAVAPCKDCEDRRQAEYIRHGSSWHELQALRKFKEEHERTQGEWIPVSERLPENRDWYLGVFKEPDTDFIGIPYICDYVGKVTKGTTNEGWILRHCTDVDNVSDYFRNLICVAWQPLPEPYKEGVAE